MKGICRFFLITQFFILISGFNQACGASWNTITPVKQSLNVGVLSTPPYSFFIQNHPTGLAFDIWTIIAKKHGWYCRYINAGNNIDEAIDKVHKGEFDVLLGQTIYYSKTAQAGHLSFPYVHSKFVLVAKRVTVQFRTRLFNTFKVVPLRMVGLFFLIYLIYLMLFYMFEYNKHSELTELGHVRAFEHILWRSLLSGTRSPPLFPSTRFIRFIALIWGSFVTVILLTLLAGITSTFFKGWMSTGEKLVHLSDLNNQVVDVLGAQSLLDKASNIGMNTGEIQHDINTAIDRLKHDKIGAVFMPQILAETYLRKNPQPDLYISSIALPSYNLGFLLSDKYEYLLRDINVDLLQLTDNGEKMPICKKYLGKTLSEKVCF